MKHLRILTLACATGALVLASGCKKDDPSIVGTWKITAATFNPPITIGSATYTDAYSLLLNDACEQDNLFIFKDGNVVLEDEGATKCDAADPQQTSSTYNLSGSNLTIYSDDTTMFTNVSIDEEHLKASFTTDMGAGNTANIDLTWTRQ